MRCYSDSFAAFIVVTNFLFYRGSGVDDIRNIINYAKQAELRKISKNAIATYIQKLAHDTNLCSEQILSTLQKIELEERNANLEQIEYEIIHAIAEIGSLAQAHIDQLRRASSQIQWLVFNAGSLAVENLTPESYQNVGNFQVHIDNLRIANKRIALASVPSLLQEAASLTTGSELLTIAEFVARDGISLALDRLKYKMTLGKVSYLEIEQMIDDVACIEALFVKWKEKYGLDEANQRLAHIEHMALSAARAATRSFLTSTEHYGPEMLVDVRRRLVDRVDKEHYTLFGCRSEHLVGAVGLLTDECKVWWSTIPEARVET